MSDETNSPNDLTEWEREGGEATLSVISRAALVGDPSLGIVRGFIGEKPVTVIVAAFADEQDPNADGVLTTPLAVLLLGDVARLVTFPEDQGTLVDNPDYVGPPVPASV
jgi:hypothetical protein